MKYSDEILALIPALKTQHDISVASERESNRLCNQISKLVKAQFGIKEGQMWMNKSNDIQVAINRLAVAEVPKKGKPQVFVYVSCDSFQSNYDMNLEDFLKDYKRV